MTNIPIVESTACLYVAAMEFNEVFPSCRITDSAHTAAVKHWLRQKDPDLGLACGTLLDLESPRHIVDWTCGHTQESPNASPVTTHPGLVMGRFISLTAVEFEERLALATNCSATIEVEDTGQMATVLLMTAIIGADIDIAKEA